MQMDLVLVRADTEIARRSPRMPGRTCATMLSSPAPSPPAPSPPSKGASRWPGEPTVRPAPTRAFLSHAEHALPPAPGQGTGTRDSRGHDISRRRATAAGRDRGGPEEAIVQQDVGQIPCSHNVVLLGPSARHRCSETVTGMGNGRARQASTVGLARRQANGPSAGGCSTVRT